MTSPFMNKKSNFVVAAWNSRRTITKGNSYYCCDGKFVIKAYTSSLYRLPLHYLSNNNDKVIETILHSTTSSSSDFDSLYFQFENDKDDVMKYDNDFDNNMRSLSTYLVSEDTMNSYSESKFIFTNFFDSLNDLNVDQDDNLNDDDDDSDIECAIPEEYKEASKLIDIDVMSYLGIKRARPIQSYHNNINDWE